MTHIQILVFGDSDYSPSRRMLEIVHEVAAGRYDVQVDHADVWQDPERAVAHSVLTVPTTLIFVAGIECERLSGRRNANAVARAIDRAATSDIPVDLSQPEDRISAPPIGG